MESINTIEGRNALARIVTQARAGRKVRQFARLVGVSHPVISRLERAETKNPSDDTLIAIARFTDFSFEELKGILASRLTPEVRQYRTAQEAWIIIRSLPREEKAMLGQMILAELGGLPNPD